MMGRVQSLLLTGTALAALGAVGSLSYVDVGLVEGASAGVVVFLLLFPVTLATEPLDNRFRESQNHE